VRTVARLLAVMALIVLAGSLLFAAAERISLGRALYFTLATLSTVGYGDVVPHTAAGRWVAIALMVGGIWVAVYVFGVILSFLVEGRLRSLMGVRRMKRAIERMERHYIVCGYGRLGRVIGEQLAAADADFVIIERDPVKAAAARERGLAVVEGDATEADTLTAAGLERAAGLATTMSDDAENLYIALTARATLPALPIVCRSSGERARAFFLRAGLERTVSTDELGARRLMAHLMHPQVVEFIDEISRPEPGRQSLHTLRLEPGGPLDGHSLSDCGLRHEFGIVVLAIHRDGAFMPNPGGEEQLRAGDILLVIGLPEQVERLRREPAGSGA
jgi:voltage-gated potassium channel